MSLAVNSRPHHRNRWNTIRDMADSDRNDTEVNSEKGAPIAGWRVLVTMALLIAAIVAVGYIAARHARDARRNQPPLSWQQRADWPDTSVRQTSLRATPVQAFLEDTEWRELHLTLDPETQRTIQTLADRARHPDFTEPATRRQLEAVREKQPDLFYATYLLATWHQANGHADKAAALYERAIADAPRVIRQRYITPRNRPLTDLPVGRIEVICYRIKNDQLNDTLQLVYPVLTTDEQGYVYLPVYDTVYEIGARAEPNGYKVRYGDVRAFRFPGRVGTLPPAMVDRRPNSTTAPPQPAP